jgi:hypothetical protein
MVADFSSSLIEKEELQIKLWETIKKLSKEEADNK